MNEFHIDDVSENETISEFILNNSDMKNQMSKFSSYPINVYKTPISSSILLKLEQAIKESFDTYGWYGFLLGNFNSNRTERSKLYGGFSITYNKNHWQNLPINAQTLGNQRYNLEDIFEGEEGKKIWDLLSLNENTHKTKSIFYGLVEKTGVYNAIDYLLECNFITEEQHLIRKHKYKNCNLNQLALKQRKKNTYSDTLGYAWRTPASKYTYLGTFLDSSKRTLVRGRVATLKYPLGVHWHVDENIFFNTRVNIPVYSSISCKAYISENYSFINNPGFMYCWDTELPHKIDIIEGIGERTAIVCGFSPWWDFDPIENIWKKNEFYGQLHPFEMFKNNQFFDLRLVN